MPIVPIDHQSVCPAADADSDNINSDNPVDDKGDYEVGYGRPPKRTRFKKGRSGNPKGRPKWAKGLNTIIREEMLAKVPVRTRTGERSILRAQAMVLKLLEVAGKGDMRALRLLLDLYMSAVPDAPQSTAQPELVDFTGADKAILGALRDELVRESGSREPSTHD